VRARAYGWSWDQGCIIAIIDFDDTDDAQLLRTGKQAPALTHAHLSVCLHGIDPEIVGELKDLVVVE
jgi:hypothetical protein